MDTDLAIRASGLTRVFDKKVAVDNVDLAIKQGEIYGFLGPNGAGKSTTIRMLVTLLSPTNGNAWVMGHSIHDDATKVRLSIGVALQDVALDEQQTGAELVRLQGRLYGLSSEEVSRRLAYLREIIDIGDALDRRIKTYSGGMKRRLDLAAALVHNPTVLFLDEPTAGLDPVSRMRVWEEIRKLNKELGVTIFLTTQYLEEADHLVDRVGIISQGRIVAEGTPAELKRKIGEDLVIIQTQNDVESVVAELRNVPKVGRIEARGKEIAIASADGSKIIGSVAVALHQAGIQVEQLTLRTPNLDDVFLEVTGNRMQKNNNHQGVKP
ncbi:MAG: ATP-binding cassette domain-containing protein [Thaumarchaeota archaeon]|nr:ATP-binding cassette domain-containing protein [Nitrososphaerota archaeon]